mmetsp:Transcript_28583/g.80569  ORF Transcript_28583/g.80569 Transcript_28583/m.80569 type:complete len:299 (+) Transcript_28583:226-1122(+)
MMDTSSVTSRDSFTTSSMPSCRSPGRMTCGVWTSHRAERWRVFTTNPSAPTSLIVGFTGTPSTAAPVSMASVKHAMHSSAVTRGRAESWIATSSALSAISLKPLVMLSCLSAPGRANLTGLLEPTLLRASSNMCLQEGSHTITTSPTSFMPRNVSRLQVAMGRPRSSRYCLGMDAPIRLPTPPDSSTMLTDPSASSALVKFRTAARRETTPCPLLNGSLAGCWSERTVVAVGRRLPCGRVVVATAAVGVSLEALSEVGQGEAFAARMGRQLCPCNPLTAIIMDGGGKEKLAGVRQKSR